ncbi:MAG: hypothetical protein U0670_03895 [Anaerolineae bacterium]
MADAYAHGADANGGWDPITPSLVLTAAVTGLDRLNGTNGIEARTQRNTTVPRLPPPSILNDARTGKGKRQSRHAHD